jgi:hypothetical protein
MASFDGLEGLGNDNCVLGRGNPYLRVSRTWFFGTTPFSNEVWQIHLHVANSLDGVGL